MSANEKPLVVQSDGSILLEVDSPVFGKVRDYLIRFAELEKSPEHIYTYKVTVVSLWNAASFDIDPDQVIEFLNTYSKYRVPRNIEFLIHDSISKYGKVKMIKDENENYYLVSEDRLILEEIKNYKGFGTYLLDEDEKGLIVDGMFRGHIKHALINLGYPVEDLAGYIEGEPKEINLRETTLEGNSFELRAYQKDCVDIFYSDGSERGGAGVIVLPCGAGKTVVGIGVMAKVKSHTLIITTGITACKQWKRELLDKTDIPEEDIGEYNGEQKVIKPITIATYKIITYRKNKKEDFKHFDIFFKSKWGLIVYDEVHLLPAPVIRVASEIQSTRRLGLTATLVREDGLEKDVFSLIGPKKFDMPWRELEDKSFIAEALCYDIRIPLAEEMRMKYVTSTDRGKFRISSENPIKYDIIEILLDKLQGKNILIIGQYIDQLEKIKKRFGYPIITGKTPQKERDVLYNKFKTGEHKALIVSKVANFAIDLPDANALIQVSGTFGSRQEEAQRLGRVLRPKEGENTSFFFSVITENSKEEEFAHKRQLFLTEQGYYYEILERKDLADFIPGK